MKKLKKKTGALTRILRVICARFGVGAPKDGLALKPKAVVNVVAEENYMPTISPRWWMYEKALRDGISISPDCLKGCYSPSVKLATKPKVKSKRRKEQKPVGKGN